MNDYYPIAVLVLGLVCLAAFGSGEEASESKALLARVDHLVLGTPDLDAGIQEVWRRLGVRATPGGSHPAWGTRNALIALGEETYLEILAPDTQQPAPRGGRPLGLDEMGAPRLVTWAAKGSELEEFVRGARGRGVEPGQVSSGSRRRPDGVLLTWKLTDFTKLRGDGLVPFFIDWGETPHPASTSAKGCRLVGLRGEHPRPEEARKMLRAMGVALPVSAGPSPALVATILAPRGTVELR